jgi:hypothetical protein
MRRLCRLAPLALLAPVLAAPVLAACDGPSLVGVGAANVVSLTLVGRAVPDILVSGVSGRDCSIVRIDRGQSYCAPVEPAPGPPPYCTPSLGRVDCWVTRPPSVPMARGVVDGPSQLSPAQEANRTAHWPLGGL